LKILVLNSGSSSVKYQLFENDKCLYKGLVEEVKDYEVALDGVFETLIKNEVISSLRDIDACGHRVVHGGEKFSAPIVVNDEVIKAIKEVAKFAPLHNLANLKGIQTAQKKLPNVPQVAVFDTAFHQTIPSVAFTYALPFELYEKQGIRKYGFHGTSHHYVAKQAAKHLQKPLQNLNLITAHLGNGCSITAIKNGKSIDTSMGLTPLEGLMMGTRSGDIDPAIIFYLNKELGYTIEEIETMLNKKSGLLGVSQKSSDLRTILENQNDKNCALALEMFTYKIKKYIGSYSFILGNVDAIIFTGGIGENSSNVREMIMNDKIDKAKNEQQYSDALEIQVDGFNSKVLVIRTNEELEIASLTKKQLEAL
jgi:acetate kinase